MYLDKLGFCHTYLVQLFFHLLGHGARGHNSPKNISLLQSVGPQVSPEGSLFVFVLFFFKTRSHYVTLAVLELTT